MSSKTTSSLPNFLHHYLPCGYLGPEVTHTHLAAQSWWQTLSQQNVELKSFATLHQLLQAVANGDVASAVIPLENGLFGSVTEVLDAMSQNEKPFEILAEWHRPIQHALIHALPNPDLSTIESVWSHPQALGQCQNQLKIHLPPNVQLHTTPSTAEAVSQLASRGPKSIALGPPDAAKHYGLNIIHPDLSDFPHNATRFLWVYRPNPSQPGPSITWLPSILPQTAPPLGVKTSLCIRLNDRPGVLVDTLLVFKAYGVNMTRIESRPAKEIPGAYYFFIDVDHDLSAPEFERVWMYLNADSAFLQSFGPYLVVTSPNSIEP